MVSARLDIRGARERLAMSPDEAERLVEQEATALHERRQARRPRGRNGQTPRCQSCNRFLSSTSRPCESCGYLQGLGWVAA